MYLHLGDNVAVPSRSVIGVFDLETSTVAKDTRLFLDNAQRNGRVMDVCDDIPKAFVVGRENNKTRIYITQLSSSTLKKRTQ